MTAWVPVVVLAGVVGDPDDLAAGGCEAGDELLPAGVLDALYFPPETMTRTLLAPGVVGLRASSRAATAVVKSSYLPAAVN